MNLSGRVALVTGGSRGIGRAIALALGRAGAATVLGFRERAADAAAVAAELRQAGVRAAAVQANVADPEQAGRLVQEAVDRFGRLDILVNNAGVPLYKLLMDTTPAEWDHMMAVHLRGAYNCSRAALPHMLAAGGGRIVNISSVWGQIGAANEVAYSTAKAGLIGFTRALARELAMSGITVNAVAPGAVATEMIGALDAAESAALAESIPAGRIGRPEEVAAAVLYLCSDQAAYVTGQVLSPNGGLHMP